MTVEELAAQLAALQARVAELERQRDLWIRSGALGHV
jgi:hypothetical protein